MPFIVSAWLLVALALSCSESPQSGGSDRQPAPVVAVRKVPLNAEIVSPRGEVEISEGGAVAFKARITGGTIPYSVRWDFGPGIPASGREDAGEVVFTTPGTFEVALEATDAAGSKVSRTVRVRVAKDLMPVVRIDTPRDGVLVREGEPLKFSGSVRDGNGPVALSWYFGPGMPAPTVKDPGMVSFPRAGTYHVSFSAKDADGDMGEHTVRVEVKPNIPTVSILSPGREATVQAGKPFSVSGSVSDGNPPFTYHWDLGPAGTSKALSPGSVTLARPGTFRLVLTVSDAQGDQGSDSVSVRVVDNSTPLARITSPASDATVYEGAVVDFGAQVTGGDEPVRLSWDFQGVAPATGESAPRVRFPKAGAYRVSLKALDADGDSTDSSVRVTVVRDTVPKVAIVSPDSNVTLTEKGKVLFKGSVSEGNEPLTYSWQFGETAREWKGKDPGEVAFDAVGTYVVRLTVRDADGDTGSATVTVNVVKDTVPKAFIELPEGDMEIYEGEVVWFRGSVKDGNPPVTCSWDFSKGAKSSSRIEPGDVVFRKAGVYPVTFTATDADGDKDTATMSITVLKCTWVRASGGWSHSMAMKSDGSLWAWGLNSYGQLGKGVQGSTRTPIQVGFERNWAKVSVGGGYTLALKTDGALWAWGANGKGQLGNDSQKHTIAPVRIEPGSRFREIAAGTSHSLAIRSDGSLWAWGRNNEGQLGNGTRDFSATPVRVGTDTGWREIAAGEGHSLAIREDGTLWAWGLNDLGQLGDGTREMSLVPRKIGTSDRWSAVSAGKSHSIGLQKDGSLWAWGANMYGQLGDRTKVFKTTPVRVGTDTDWSMISAGTYHNLALKKNGTLWAWGWNAFGQLGTGNAHDSSVPVRISIDSDWVSLEAGENYSLGVKKNGTLWAWGYNGYSQLGCGDYEDRNTPVFIRPARKLLLSGKPYVY